MVKKLKICHFELRERYSKDLKIYSYMFLSVRSPGLCCIGPSLQVLLGYSVLVSQALLSAFASPWLQNYKFSPTCDKFVK